MRYTPILTLCGLLAACVDRPLFADYSPSQRTYLADAHAIDLACSNYVRLADVAAAHGLVVDPAVGHSHWGFADDAWVAEGYAGADGYGSGAPVEGLPLALERAQVERDNDRLKARLAEAGIDPGFLFAGD